MRTGFRTFVAASILAALAGCLFAPGAGAAFPGQNGAIAFTTYYLDGNENIYSIQPDGTGLRRLTADTGFDDDAAWSPNGRRIAFASNRAHPATACEGVSPNCDYDIYVMNADGANVKRLTATPGNDREPYWSPDGRRIVFASTRDDVRANLYVMNADGTGQTRITNDPGVDSQPAWSPGGTAIAFYRAECEFNCGTRDLFRVAPDGGGLLQLTGGSASDWKPDWSPDGTKIVFQREEFGNGFWTMNPDGTAQTRIPGGHMDPAWAPDGRKIAFGYPGIGHMNPDGGSPTTINSSGGEKPDWQPRVGPRRADYRSGSDFCRAERDFLGSQEFNAVYGTFGGCVSAN